MEGLREEQVRNVSDEFLIREVWRIWIQNRKSPAQTEQQLMGTAYLTVNIHVVSEEVNRTRNITNAYNGVWKSTEWKSHTGGWTRQTPSYCWGLKCTINVSFMGGGNIPINLNTAIRSLNKIYQKYWIWNLSIVFSAVEKKLSILHYRTFPWNLHL